MPRMMKQLIQRGYWDTPDDDGTGGKGGGGGGDDAAAKAEADKAAAAADKAKADAAAADKAKADAAAADDDSGKMGKENAELLKDVMKKKKVNKELSDKVDSLTEKLSAWGDLDVSDVKQLLKDKQDAETTALEKKGDWDKLKKQMKEQNQVVLDAKDTEISDLAGKLTSRTSIIEKLTVGHSFDNSKFIGEELTLTPSKTRIIYGAHFDVEGGTVVGYDKPRGTDGRTQLVDAGGDPLAFEAAMKKIVDGDPERDSIIRSKAKAGAGSSPSSKAPGAQGATKEKGLGRIQAALDNSKK